MTSSEGMLGFLLIISWNFSMPKTAIVFVDANNWYHNIKKYFNPGEIDISKVSALLCKAKKYKLKEIRWYASTPSIADGENMYYKHISFLKHLENSGIKVITRKLQRLSNKEAIDKKKEQLESLDLCKNCKRLVESSFLDLAELKKKEKGIDIWVAIDMIKKSVINKECDICILISGDGDFVPALELIKKKKKDILTAMVHFGYSSELINKFPFFILKKSTLIKCLRDYIGRLIKKGIPLEKKKINNKIIHLSVSKNLKKIASLSTILQLRDI